MPTALKSRVCAAKRILPRASTEVCGRTVGTEESQLYSGYFPPCQLTLQGQGHFSRRAPQSPELDNLDTTERSVPLPQWLARTVCSLNQCQQNV